MVKFLLEENGILPNMSTEYAAGYDLRCPVHTVIHPGRNLIPLNFRMEMDGDTVALIKPRSGFNLKGFEAVLITQLTTGETILNATPERLDIDVIDGVIDADFRGIVGVIVYSHIDKPCLLKAGTKFAQMLFVNIQHPELVVAEELSQTTRQDGGFGSSGTI